MHVYIAHKLTGTLIVTPYLSFRLAPRSTCFVSIQTVWVGLKTAMNMLRDGGSTAHHVDAVVCSALAIRPAEPAKRGQWRCRQQRRRRRRLRLDLALRIPGHVAELHRTSEYTVHIAARSSGLKRRIC